MIGRYRRSQQKGKSGFYIFLSLVLIIVMIKWGFPLFVKVIAGKGAEVSRDIADIIPPQSPILSALPEATNEATIAVDGFTENGAKLELMINDTLNKVGTANPDGSFSFQPILVNGSNRVQVRAIDAANNSSLSEIKIVVVDKEPVVLTVTSPKDGTEYIGKNSQSIEISGKVSKSGAMVVANGSFVDVNKDGTFLHRLLLQNGNNSIKIVASDKAGNTDEKTIPVTYTP